MLFYFLCWNFRKKFQSYENKEVDEGFNDVLLYIDNNILANGQNVFNADDLNSHKVASNILKITEELGIW